MTTRSSLLTQAIADAFGGDASKFNVDSDLGIWSGNRKTLGYRDSNNQFHWLVKNDSTFLFGQNSEPHFAAMVESPILYSGISSTSNILQAAQNSFDVLGISAHWEARWGLDEDMAVSTPWVSSLDKIPYTIDKFVNGSVNKNWRSTDSQHLIISEQVINGKYAKNSGEAFPKKRLLVGSEAPYRSHPVASGQREIRFITLDAANSKVYGTGDTNEQLKEWINAGSPLVSKPDGPGLHEISPATLISTFLGVYNGTFFNNALIKQIHLLAYDQSSNELIGMMPHGSHTEFVGIENHAGTLVKINVSNQAVTFKAVVLSPGGSNMRVTNFFYDQNLGNLMVLARVSEDTVDKNGAIVGYKESYDIIGRLDFVSSTVANITRIYKFKGAVDSNRDSDFTRISARAASSGPNAGQYYVLGSKPVVSSKSPNRWLYVVNVLDGDETEKELAYYGDNPSDGLVYSSSTDELFGVEIGGHTFFKADVSGVNFLFPESFSDDNLDAEDQGIMKISSKGPGASQDSVYTRLNVDNSRAFATYDIIAITAESNVIGKLLEFEYGDFDRGELPKIGRMLRHQSAKMTFEKSNVPQDFYFLVNRKISNSSEFLDVRHIAFNIIDASSPFDVKISRIQLLKTNEIVLNLAPTSAFFSEHNLEAAFTLDDVRNLAKFVQYRVILTTTAPPITPKIRGEVSQSIEPATVINHPSGRLRGGRRRTPHTVDQSLNFGNELYTQTPVKLPSTEIQDALGLLIE